MEYPLRILIVEDLPSDVELIKREIRKAEINCIYRCVETKDDFLSSLNDFKPDFILSDYLLPQFDGMEALHLAKKFDCTIPFILVTGSMNEETAVKCIKEGAEDYIIKEHIRQLAPAILAAKNNKQNQIAKLEAEKAMRLSEQHLRTIVELNTDGIIVSDKIGRILFANPKAESILNLQKDTILSPGFYTAINRDEISEIDIVSANGETGKAEISVIEVNWDGEPSFLVMLHEVTNRS